MNMKQRQNSIIYNQRLINVNIKFLRMKVEPYHYERKQNCRKCISVDLRIENKHSQLQLLIIEQELNYHQFHISL